MYLKRFLRDSPFLKCHIGWVRESFEQVMQWLRYWSKPWMQEHERTSYPSLASPRGCWLKASPGVSKPTAFGETKNHLAFWCQGCWQEEHNKIWQQLSVYRPQIQALNDHAVEMPRAAECLGMVFLSEVRSCPWWKIPVVFYLKQNLERFVE